MAAFGATGIPGSVGTPASTAPTLKHFSGDNQFVPGAYAPSGTPDDTELLAHPKQLTVGQELANFLSASYGDPQKVLAVQQNLIDAGLLKVNDRGYKAGQVVEGDATFKAYQQALLGAVATQTPLNDYLDSRAAQLQAQGIDTRTVTSTRNVNTTQVDLTNPTTAHSLLIKTMSDFLGRQPSPREVATFTASLNSSERANPVVTNSTVDTTQQLVNGVPVQGSDNVRSQTREGGVDPGQVAQDFVTGNYGAEADTHELLNYVNVFEQLLKGGG